LSIRVVICDLDGTLISASSELEFVLGLFRDGVLSRIIVTRFLYHYIRHPVKTILEGRGWNRGYFSGLPMSIIMEEIEKCVPKLLKKVRPGVLDLLNQYRDEGASICILSASLSPLVQSITESLGFSCFRGSIPVVRDGICTGLLIGQRPFGRAKTPPALAIMDQFGVDASEVLAIGDSWADRFILQLCGSAVVVHPGRKLRKLALKNGWRIMENRIGKS
jgi:HAD superfamily phosphoserine phosphatase-like hydrolase